MIGDFFSLQTGEASATAVYGRNQSRDPILRIHNTNVSIMLQYCIELCLSTVCSLLLRIGLR